MLCEFAASPHLGATGAKSIVDQKMEKKKKTGTPTLSPWEAGAGCLAFQLTAVSDHKSSETRCSLAAGRWLGSPGGISWAGLSWAARPYYKKKSIFQFEKKIPSDLLEASAVTGVSTRILTPCLLCVACISLSRRHLGPSGPSGHGPWEEGFLRRFFISCCG